MADIQTYLDGQPFPGFIGRTATESTPAWPVQPRPPAGTPNVVVVVLDDVGFGQIGCFGGLGGRINTPNMDRLAAGGLRYNNFHVTPMCSPTRAALMTGRNNHAVGVGCIMESVTGYPGYNGRIPKETAMLPAVLTDQGFDTMAVGKWHLTPSYETTSVGPFERWPVAQGFQRFYGFLGAGTDHWSPAAIYQDNHRVPPPSLGKPDYHLSEDLADRCIGFVEEHCAASPSRPFFLYFGFGTLHVPHHVAREWWEPYRGSFNSGWDVIRTEMLEHQKEMGVVPRDTILPPPNAGVRPWDDHSDREKELMARQMEVAAGFLTHADHELGRLMSNLEQHGVLDNTIFLLFSDNGASGEGGPLGRYHNVPEFNRVESSFDEMYAHLDDWGGPATAPHYAVGWAMAGNTPNRWYKRFTHEGGTRSPLIVHWPSRISDRGAIRSQFHHVVDLMPTLLESLKVEMPETVRGYRQRPLDGVSLAYTFTGPKEATRKEKQYFEMLGHRAIWADGWKAVTLHRSAWVNDLLDEPHMAPAEFDADRWELYNLDEDYSESNDLAEQHPDRVRQLSELWWREAEQHQALPLEGRWQMGMTNPPSLVERRNEYAFYGPVHLTPNASPVVRNRSHRITATVEIPDSGAEGVIVADGGQLGGYALFIKHGIVAYASSYLGHETVVRANNGPVRPGRLIITLQFDKTGEHAGQARLRVGHGEPAVVDIPRTNPALYDMRGGGFHIGGDYGGVSSAYTAPFPFSGGIVSVLIGRPEPEYHDTTMELKEAMQEQ